MKFKADSHLLIGHSHFNAGKHCQDYALAGVLTNSVYAVVSDGCSTGGLTDVGSRIITLASAKAIKGCSDLNDKFGPSQINLIRRDGLKQAGIILDLKSEDMLATCVYAYISPLGGFIQLEGDGVVAVKFRDGTVDIFRYDWADNTPFYPVYRENLVPFISAHGGNLEVNRFTKQCWNIKPGAAFEDVGNQEISLEDGMRGITIPLSPEGLERIEYVAVFTDGVTQIEGLPWKDAVIGLLSFKTSEGEFAKRRMNRLVKDVMKNGRGPLDDISYAVIKIEH